MAAEAGPAVHAALGQPLAGDASSRMHLLCAIPNAGPYLELSIEGPDYYPWQDGLLRPAARVVRRRLVEPRPARAGASR